MTVLIHKDVKVGPLHISLLSDRVVLEVERSGTQAVTREVGGVLLSLILKWEGVP